MNLQFITNVLILFFTTFVMLIYGCSLSILNFIYTSIIGRELINSLLVNRIVYVSLLSNISILFYLTVIGNKSR